MKTFEESKHKIALFIELTSQLKDHRRIDRGNIRHSLPEIFFLSLSAVISGCNTWASIEEYGNLKLDWFQKYYAYKYGIPSNDTLGAFFSAFDRDKFAKFFKKFTKDLAKKDSRVVAFDGKMVRGVNSKKGEDPLYIVSAFCQNNNLALGQVKVNDKSNEITAIPALIDILDLEKCVITIDAIGCQKNIAEQIIDKKADYILAVKENQKDLKEQVVKLFERQKPKNEHVKFDSDHGRIEKRVCRVIDDLTFLDGKEDWKNLTTIVQIKTERCEKKTEIITESTRYFISSLEANSKQIGQDVRGHWSIENNLHWNLDVVFEEDLQLKRKGNSTENFNMLTKIALGLIEAEKTKNKSKPIKRLIASIDDSYREKILNL